MKKKLVSTILVVFMLVGTCFAALTTKEKTLLKRIYDYYSGRFGAGADEVIQDAIMNGNEAERKAVIKTFLVDIVIPSKTVAVAAKTASLAADETELQEFEDWVAAN